MKKLMVAACAALCATVGFSEEAAVQSANIVGYVTQDVSANKYVMLGCPFESTAGENLNIQNFISGNITAYNWPEGSEERAWIQIQQASGTGYDQYYLSWEDGDEENPIFLWMTAGGDEADVEIKPGFSCWFKNPTACTITVAGQVADPSKGSVTVSPNKYEMIANPFPMDVKLNSDKLNCKGLTAYNWPEGSEERSWIQIPAKSGSGYDQYYLSWEDGDEDNPVFLWMTAGGDEADVTIKAFTGFWLKDPNGGTIKFAL